MRVLMAARPAFRFDGRNVHAQALAARQAARYVTRVSEETRLAIRQLIVNSLDRGIPAHETARLLRSIVGLTSQGSAAVSNYYRGLLVRGENEVRAAQYADKYARKLLKVRAMTIARTEIMGALNAGALEQAMQRREAGLFRDPHKTWSITPDEVTCRICRPLDGWTIPLDSAFPLGRETGPGDASVTAVLAPPAHPNCRCSLTFSENAPRRKLPSAAPAPGKWNLQGEDRQEYAQELLRRRGR